MDLIGALFRTRQQRRHALAVSDGEMQWTWDEFVDRTGRLAGALRGLGVTNGRNSAILSYSSARVFEYFYAVPWAGAAVCPLNYRLTADELTEMVEDCAPEALVVDDAFVDVALVLKSRVSGLRNLVYAGSGPTPASMIAYEELIAESASPCEPHCQEADVACLYYSGGTTGRPKGVMLTHGNVVANAMNFAIATGVSDQDRLLHCGPLFHVASGSRIYNAGIFGATSIIMPRFDAGGVLENVERHGITIVSLVPTMLSTIVHLPEFDRRRVGSLRMILYGASQISLSLLKTVIARFEGIALCQGYGQTETAPFATVLGPRYHALDGPFAGKLQSAGRAIGSVEVRVVDPDDREVPPRTIGEVIVRGPNVMKGYFNQPELTRVALRGGWMHSGDLGYFDDDGFLFIVDRLKDMIISGGENVYSVEVENAIASHPEVAECAVFGIPHELWGESVHAVVVPWPGGQIDSASIVAHCQRLIGGYKVPRSVQIRAEPLPLSSANKILKRILREEHLMSRRHSDDRC